MEPKLDVMRIDDLSKHVPAEWSVFYSDDDSRSLYQIDKTTKQLQPAAALQIPCVFLQFSHFTVVYYHSDRRGGQLLNFDSTGSGIHLNSITKFTGVQSVGLNTQLYQAETVEDKYCGEYCLYFIWRRKKLLSTRELDDVSVVMLPLVDAMFSRSKWLIANWTFAMRIGMAYENNALEASLKDMLNVVPRP